MHTHRHTHPVDPHFPIASPKPLCIYTYRCDSPQDIIRQADEVNRIPLPPIPDKFGVRLPPLEYQTTLPNLQWDVEADAPPEEETSPVSTSAPTGSVITVYYSLCGFGIIVLRTTQRGWEGRRGARESLFFIYGGETFC